MIELFLIMNLGFLGSFGHCLGMCGPLVVAFSLANPGGTTTWKQRLVFHSLLNLGRILSYILVGAGIGAVGSVLLAGGQLAGIDSILRQGLAILTGLLLIWMGLAQITPKGFPHLPILHPLLQGGLHHRLEHVMRGLSRQTYWWTPAFLGLTWGLIPCGFLYVAQIKAAETGEIHQGALTLLAFGLGTVPAMFGVGVSAASLSADRRSQLFRLGGWVTLTIGILTLLRTGAMTDYTGHAALFCLMLALVARPISCLWPQPLRYRRLLGVGAFILAVAHSLHSLNHTLDWNLDAVNFLLPEHQWGIWTGLIALALMTPAVLTSHDRLINLLGKFWRLIHLLTMPALVLAVVHTALIGSHYLGNLEGTMATEVRTVFLGIGLLFVLLVRQRWFWFILRLEKFYVSQK
ncbi:ferric reductase [Leptolyngbya sp. 'hensonii']|uniref:urease accessory protein UreH domain-containing protein n=1 Tax=Leptolyngbya sp. 'hensonii' TaxID=1922337 RepID=UPI00094FC568|nr:sulfite exporter TauE/SafE family protein [Leptolyngbya sp. 'hensonii']OLP16199.1 ferric reductase [Leptolyngbya sp. 'hensonii']